MRNLYFVYPIAADIVQEYQKHRKSGKSRETAVIAIEVTYADELKNPDSATAVFLGLVYALCKKNELTLEVAQKAREQIEKTLLYVEAGSTQSIQLHSTLQMMEDNALYGPEAVYLRRKKYSPDWTVGDVLAHTIAFEDSRKQGMYGGTILLTKVGEYVDELGACTQLLYASICHSCPDPLTAEQLQNFGFVRTMCVNSTTWKYLFQIEVKSKRQLETLGLSKIAHFDFVALPRDRVQEKAEVAMPLFFGFDKDSVIPRYEKQIYQLYMRWGTSSPRTI